MLPGFTGVQKLGQPVPDSNFASDLNRGAPQPMQWYTPVSLLFQYLPVNAGSVPHCRVTRNCSGVSFSRHSSSVLTTFSLATFSLIDFGLPPVAHQNSTSTMRWRGVGEVSGSGAARVCSRPGLPSPLNPS